MSRRQRIIDIFGLAGFACFIWGIGRLSVSAALIVGGAFFILGSLLISRDNSGK